MSSSEQLTCVISGSFKFKPEIDQTYDELEDNNIRVLGPEKGWFAVARNRLILPDEFGSVRPLPNEKGMPPAAIENQFLAQLHKANFTYLANFEDYVGEMTAFEIGHAIGWKKPIYSHKALDVDFMDKWQDWNPGTLDLLARFIRVVPIPEIEEDYHRQPETDYLTA